MWRPQHYLLDAGDRVMGNRSWTGKQSVPETGSGSPRSLCSRVAGLASLGRPADVALLGYLDSDVQDQTQCFQEPPIVPGPSTDQEVPMGGQHRTDATRPQSR